MQTELPLRELAAAADMVIGAAVGTEKLADPAFREIFVREFNGLVAENEMKWKSIHPERDSYRWDLADQLVELAEAEGMRVRGHTLLWHNANPDWLAAGNFSRDELFDIMADHIRAVAGRYKGRIFQWDVLNEAFDDNDPCELRRTIWLDGLGPEYIEQAFRLAHEAAPDAVLFYNDYSAERIGPKSDAIYKMLAEMKGRGVPVHGMGFQCHIDQEFHESTEENFRRFVDLGLEIAVTELDVRLHLPATAESLARQAHVYEQTLRLFHRCGGKVFMLWGVNDKYSWVQRFPGFAGYGAALPFDDDFQPKPAYAAIARTFHEFAAA